MKNIFEDVIKNGHYKLDDMLAKINKYHISGELTDEDKEELVNMARYGAEVKNDVDLFAKVVELEARIKALEEGNTPESTEEYPEYIKGKWYYRGDKCSENGKNYKCIAPEGAVCTWSPSEYPAYWEIA